MVLMKFKYVDLFSGCGGLSLGLESVGGELVVAVERSPMAAETFFHNFVSRIDSPDQWSQYISEPIASQAQRGLIVSELQKVLADEATMRFLQASHPDVVVGGPPCQGFSLAGRRNPNDIRNILPWQFLEMVEKTKPKMVVIENVVGMRHKFNKDDGNATVFDQLQIALAETTPGYEVQAVEVNALHFGAPQHRPRLMIIGLRKDLAMDRGITTTGTLWKSNFLDLLNHDTPPLAPKPTVFSSQARTVGQAIGDLSGSTEKKLADFDLLEEFRSDWGVLKPLKKASTPNHVVRKHSEQSINRFRLYQWMTGNSIDTRLLSKVASLDAPEQVPFIQKHISKVDFPAQAPDGTVLAKNATELCALIIQLQTKKHSQRVLEWDKPSRTVVTIGDDYVHPFEPRTFTVRELARFQGFPNSFEFRSKETTGGVNRKNEVPQYSQVGNAVSPYLAKAVGELITRTLEGRSVATSRRD
jgi:DNA (cytosine-5)-methyltransferase 1